MAQQLDEALYRFEPLSQHRRAMDRQYPSANESPLSALTGDPTRAAQQGVGLVRRMTSRAGIDRDEPGNGSAGSAGATSAGSALERDRSGLRRLVADKADQGVHQVVSGAVDEPGRAAERSGRAGGSTQA